MLRSVHRYLKRARSDRRLPGFRGDKGMERPPIGRPKGRIRVAEPVWGMVRRRQGVNVLLMERRLRTRKRTYAAVVVS